jgi:RimJ/RimL family protein N-acetyltransferase
MIRVRPFDQNDVSLFADYLYRSPRGFLEKIGLDPGRLLPEEKFREVFSAMVEKSAAPAGPPPTCLSILWNGLPVGAHTLTEVKAGASAVMHAHLWREEFRGKGIGQKSYLLAASFFVKEHGFQEILFRTPADNPGPNRVKEKLGIPKVGEGLVDTPVSLPGLKANLYRLDRALLARLLKSAGI